MNKHDIEQGLYDEMEIYLVKDGVKEKIAHKFYMVLDPEKGDYHFYHIKVNKTTGEDRCRIKDSPVIDIPRSERDSLGEVISDKVDEIMKLVSENLFDIKIIER